MSCRLLDTVFQYKPCPGRCQESRLPRAEANAVAKRNSATELTDRDQGRRRRRRKMTLKMEAEVPDEMEGVRYQSRRGILAGRLISREVDAANRAKRGEERGDIDERT